MVQRCVWCLSDPLYIDYHDNEWGIPVYSEEKLFEMLVLESMQAGLSWFTILKKREDFRKALDQFNPEKIARYSPVKLQKLLLNPKIIRNRSKLEATIANAKAFLRLKEQGDKQVDFFWQFTDGRIIQNRWHSSHQIPAITPQSEKMAKALKKNGFRFMGPTTCYAFMQAVGMVNDHLTCCYRYDLLKPGRLG